MEVNFISWEKDLNLTNPPQYIYDIPECKAIADLVDLFLIFNENGDIVGTFSNNYNLNIKGKKINTIFSSNKTPIIELKDFFHFKEKAIYILNLDIIMTFKAVVLQIYMENKNFYVWAGVELEKNSIIENQDEYLYIYKKMFQNPHHLGTQGYAITDINYKVVKFNNSFASILNQNNESLKGKYILDIIHFKQNFEQNEKLTDFFVDEIPLVLNDQKISTSKGFIYISITLFKIENHLCIIIHDISDLKIKEKELLIAKYEAEKSAKIKETFLTNISHELRTPLNAIVGMTEMLQQTEINTKQKKFLSVIAHSADSLKSIINDILEVTQIGAENFGLEMKPFRVLDVIELIQNYTFIKVAENDIQIEYNCIDIIENLFVIGDASRIVQILKNLVSNAFKFTLKGTVRLSIKCINETDTSIKLHFEVLDTGIGISEEQKKRIFTLFAQRELGVVREYGGVGLGLYLTNRLVEKCGGDLKLESEVGFGSIFHFDLTFEKSNIIHDDSNLNFSSVNTLKDKRILLIEDQEFNQFLVTANEKKWNCIIDVANNGKIGIEKLNQNDYDIILMDILMPVMGGEEATHFIRNQMLKPKCDIPIIALTANALKGDREKYLQLGMTDYLSKPFKPSQLLSVLLRTLNATTTISATQEAEMILTENNIYKSEPAEYDLSEIQTLSNGNKDFVIKMLNIFIHSAFASIDEVNQLKEKLLYRDIVKAIHKIKSPSKLLKINNLIALIHQIESKISEQFNQDDLNFLIQEYSVVLSNVANKLSNELKSYS